MTARALPQPPRRRRRRRLVTVLATLLALPGLAAAVLVGLWIERPTDATGDRAHAGVRALSIPPLADSRVENGRRIFELEASAGTTDFGLGDGETETWGFNGTYLGPTLRAARGEKVQVNVTNGLDEATTVHWHGHHLPARMDGGPHQPIEPGETWSPRWKIDQPAATTWYHPHPHGETADHVYRGLAGMFILDDPDNAPDGLPTNYGVDDIPLIVQDRNFGPDGQFDDDQPMFSSVGFLGDTVLANGTADPYLDVTTEQVRLRLLNGSNGRIYNFGMADGRPIQLIGTDGGLLAEPHRTTRVQLSPGERAEILVRMAPGETTLLRSYPPTLGTDPWNNRFAGGADSFDILELRAADSLTDSAELPARLADAPDLDPDDAVRVRRFRLGGSNINGLKMDAYRIDEVVERDTTEIWEINNPGNTPHNFHVHDVQFQVLDIDGREPTAELAGWKDTIYARPGTTTRIALRFTDYSDPDVPYMFHCHILRHEDRGMMGQFVVVEPGENPGKPPAKGHGH